jgi:hypothetical protein
MELKLVHSIGMDSVFFSHGYWITGLEQDNGLVSWTKIGFQLIGLVYFRDIGLAISLDMEIDLVLHWIHNLITAGWRFVTGKMEKFFRACHSGYKLLCASNQGNSMFYDAAQKTGFPFQFARGHGTESIRSTRFSWFYKWLYVLYAVTRIYFVIHFHLRNK